MKKLRHCHPMYNVVVCIRQPLSSQSADYVTLISTEMDITGNGCAMDTGVYTAK